MTQRRPDIRVENSAPSQRRSAYSVRWATPILIKAGARRALDFGSGTLRNLKILERSFDEVTLVETPKRCQSMRPKVQGRNAVSLLSTDEFYKNSDTYDAAFLVCVLHTIPNPRERQRIVNKITEMLRPGGYIVVDVPQSETYYNRRKQELTRYKDGFLLRWGGHFTFYKSFYAEELDALFQSCSLVLFKKIWRTKHLIRIWQKPPMQPVGRVEHLRNPSRSLLGR
jgi:SAM-dependent methyltransferase